MIRVGLLGFVLALLAMESVAAGRERVPEPEFQALRERLSEREDENRPEEPFLILDVLGRELAVSGTLNLDAEGTSPVRPTDPPDGNDRLLLEPELEAEFLWLLAPNATLFVQSGLVVGEFDVLPRTQEALSEVYFERGEMWLNLTEIGGLPLELQIGRIDLDDDRTFWWDTDLDGVRLTIGREPLELEVSVLYELGPKRSNQDDIDVEEADRLRVLGEVGWEYSPEHVLELYFLYDDDRSGRNPLGSSTRSVREDESDATLLWLGPRSTGGWLLHPDLALGYWGDGAFVFGEDRLIDYESGDPGRSVVDAKQVRDVLGWAVDFGVTFFIEVPFEPRVSFAYAMGSADGDDDSKVDRAFRQTDLQSNEMGFGGVQRYNSYGRFLDPELSNLQVFTAGTGMTLGQSSSLDLAYHHYRLVQSAEELRSARYDIALDGHDLELGDTVDLVLAIEESLAFQIEASLSAFRAGPAVARDPGDWGFGGLLAVRFAF